MPIGDRRLNILLATTKIKANIGTVRISSIIRISRLSTSLPKYPATAPTRTPSEPATSTNVTRR
jgi:hypothetical protein